MPEWPFKVSSKAGWLIVLKAADRSIRMRRQASPSSKALWISSEILSMAVSMLHPFLNPDWKASRRLKSSICLLSWWRTHFSKVLARNGRLEIGLRLLRSLGSAPGFLSIGLICPTWRETGTQPVVREELMILVQKGVMTWIRFCTNADGRGSKVWEVGFKLAIILKTWISDTRSKSVHFASFFSRHRTRLVLVWLRSTWSGLGRGGPVKIEGVLGVWM